MLPGVRVYREACPVRTIPKPQQWGQLQCSRRRAREGQAWGAQFGEYDHQRVLVVLFLHGHGREWARHSPEERDRLAHSPLLRPYPVPLVTHCIYQALLPPGDLRKPTNGTGRRSRDRVRS